MPYFSVTIPVYNVEKYVKQCIDSILEQTFQDFEIIIVDDGSTDSSGAICDEYAKKHTNIKVIHKSNEGLLLARRTALQKVSGKVVLFLDSDDYWDKELLENVYSTFQKYSCDMVMYRYRCVDENNQHLYQQKKLLPDMTVIENANEYLSKELGMTYEYNSLCLKAVKRECIDTEEDYSLYKGLSMGEDALQTVSIAQKIESFVYLDKPLYQYRIIQQSMTRTISEKYLRDYLNVRKRVIDNIKAIKGYDGRTLSKVNEYTLRGFFVFLADFSQNKGSGSEWKIKYNKIVKEYKNYLIDTKKQTAKGVLYKTFLEINSYFIYKMFGKMKRILLRIYNMSLR